jgi:hypothetical protein
MLHRDGRRVLSSTPHLPFTPGPITLPTRVLRGARASPVELSHLSGTRATSAQAPRLNTPRMPLVRPRPTIGTLIFVSFTHLARHVHHVLVLPGPAAEVAAHLTGGHVLAAVPAPPHDNEGPEPETIQEEEGQQLATIGSPEVACLCIADTKVPQFGKLYFFLV